MTDILTDNVNKAFTNTYIHHLFKGMKSKLDS